MRLSKVDGPMFSVVAVGIVSMSCAPTQSSGSIWTEGAPLPVAVTNNATVGMETDSGPFLFSFAGLDTSRTWSGVHSRAFSLDLGREPREWQEIPPVPGPGRLAATAQAVGSRAFVFGGYTVDEDGDEVSTPNVEIWELESRGWHRGADIPVPTDDAVSGVRGELIYLVSGWHDRGNIAEVQIYDTDADAWTAGTPVPGPPVFGHAGAVAGNSIVYIDGVRVDSDPRAFVLEGSSWRGDIDPADPTSITWRRLAPHPGPPLYRAAAAAWGDWVIFAGGTDNPYNFDGIGYDGVPAQPRTAVFAYNIRTDTWSELTPLPRASMDHRGLAVAGDTLYLVGGMGREQRVSSRVWMTELSTLLGGPS